ncbi:MAG: hypothetical protein ABEI52_00780, partial [Halobacteriaceae archaeon]
KIHQTLDDINRGSVTVQMGIDDDQALLRRFAKRVVFAILTTSGLIALALVAPTRDPVVLGFLGVGTLIAGYLFNRARKQQSGIQAQPKFTRQAMREQQSYRAYPPADTGDIEPDSSEV